MIIPTPRSQGFASLENGPHQQHIDSSCSQTPSQQQHSDSLPIHLLTSNILIHQLHTFSSSTHCVTRYILLTNNTQFTSYTRSHHQHTDSPGIQLLTNHADSPCSYTLYHQQHTDSPGIHLLTKHTDQPHTDSPNTNSPTIICTTRPPHADPPTTNQLTNHANSPTIICMTHQSYTDSPTTQRA